MNKKIIILLISSLLLCGCSADIDLVVTDDVVSEKIVINDVDPRSFYKNVPFDYQDFLPDTVDEDFYDAKINYYDYQQSSNQVTYQHVHSINDIGKSRLFNDYLNDYLVKKNIDDNSKIFEMKGIDLYRFYQLNNVKFNLKTDYQVLEHNADHVDNGIYTWNITKDNCRDKYIYFKLSPEKSTSVVIVNDTSHVVISGDENDINNRTEIHVDYDLNKKTDQINNMETDEEIDEESNTYIIKYVLIGIGILFGGLLLFGIFNIIKSNI